MSGLKAYLPLEEGFFMAKCESCVFDLKTAVVAVYKGFEKSPAAGLKAIKHTVDDIISHKKEDSGLPYFKNVLRKGIDAVTGLKDLFWPEYDRSVGRSMRRNEGLLIVNDAPKNELAKAKGERKMWQNHLLPAILDLKEGEAVQFLALRTTTAAEGVAFQQVSLKNGELVLESHLTPFNQEIQVNSFMELISEKREDLSVVPGEGVDAAIGWMIKGSSIDFEQVLPELMLEAMTVDTSTILWEQPVFTRAWPKLNQPISFELASSVSLDPVMVATRSTPPKPVVGVVTDRVVSVEPNSFWWQLLAAQVGAAARPTVGPESEVVEVVTVEQESFVAELKESSQIVESVTEIVITRPVEPTVVLKPEKKVVVTDKKQEVKSEPAQLVKIKTAKSEKKSENPVEPEKFEIPQSKTTIYEVFKPLANKAVKRIPELIKERRHQEPPAPEKVQEKVVKEPKKVEPDIPWWQMSFEGIDANDVPEWQIKQLLWPDFNYLKDFSWLVSIRQYLLTNTNWYQFNDDLRMVPMVVAANRGSDEARKAILVELTG